MTSPEAREATMKRLLAEEIARFGEVRLPWMAFPGVHPFHIHWRMGEGELQLELLALRAQTQTTSERAAQLREGPIPADWAWWACERIGVIDEDEAATTFGPYELTFVEVREALVAQGMDVAGSPEVH